MGAQAPAWIKRLAVLLSVIIACTCLLMSFVILDGPTAGLWAPVALTVPALTMAAVCFDRRLPIGHYVLAAVVGTLGIYWIALGVASYADMSLEGTAEAAWLCRIVGSTEPKVEWVDKAYNVLFFPFTLMFFIMGFVWLLPTRRVWDRKNTDGTASR